MITLWPEVTIDLNDKTLAITTEKNIFKKAYPDKAAAEREAEELGLYGHFTWITRLGVNEPGRILTTQQRFDSAVLNGRNFIVKHR